MPIPDRVARTNRYVANPIVRTFAGRIPPFAIVFHRGRKSGRVYQTPIMAYRTADGYVVALTYGANRDWVTNVLHTGGCYLQVRGRRVRLDSPEIIEGRPGMESMPGVIRPFLKLLGVDKFLILRSSPAA